MDYALLTTRARRGDRDAAAALLPIARDRSDLLTVLTCWQLLLPHRHSAAQALLATLRAGEARSSGQNGESGATQKLRLDIVARALVDGTRRAGGDDHVTRALLEVADAILVVHKGGGVADPSLGEACTTALLASTDDACLEALARVKASCVAHVSRADE